MQKYTYGVKGEEYVLKKLEKCTVFKGISGVPGSGNQFYAKEDLKSDLFILQVKTTEKDSFRITHKDFALLDTWGIKNSLIPLFVIFFEVRDTIKLAFDVSYLDLFRRHGSDLPDYPPIKSKNITILYTSEDCVFPLKEYQLYLTDAKNISR
jgi:hypothetical protein